MRGACVVQRPRPRYPSLTRNYCSPDTASHEALQALPSRMRLVLSGTPLQNSECWCVAKLTSLPKSRWPCPLHAGPLSPYYFTFTHRPPFSLLIHFFASLPDLHELWALVDFFSWGSLLGPIALFRRSFAASIERGRERGASAIYRKAGDERTQALGQLLRPHLLQRRKVDVVDLLEPELELSSLAKGVNDVNEVTSSKVAADASERRPRMAAKTEILLWSRLVEAQARLPVK